MEDLVYMKFEDVYNKIISEMKYVSGPYASYKINDDALTPIIYKDVCICVSALNDDVMHVINRLKKRTKGQYDINTVLTIIKRYIDKDLNFKNLFNDKNRDIYSCSIKSKEFNLIKVQVTFERNNARDIFSDGIEGVKYFCFIYTVLLGEMDKKESDIELNVESIEVN